MNTKKIILLFLVFLYHTLHAQLLIKEDFKNVFVYENSCKLISYELSKENNFNKLLNDDPPFESNQVYGYECRMNVTNSYSYWTTYYFYAGNTVTFEIKI